MTLRDELVHRWGHRIAVLKVPTSDAKSLLLKVQEAFLLLIPIQKPCD
jgi:hypothetical protein